MTKIVVDTNIVFSALLNVDSRIGQILINGRRFYSFFAPEYLKSEIIDHKGKIKELAQFSDDTFLETYELILRNITILNHSIIPLKLFQKSEKLCKSIDIDDTIFVAITEFTRGKLWTGDFILMNGLIEKGYKRLIKTEELYQDFITKSKSRK
jgi:predicted nucleic acid-binding protein